jgi:molybdate transport system substrate-binding protein
MSAYFPLLACLLLPPNASPQALLVAAASDLAPLEKPLRAGFSRHTGLDVNFSFGSSGMLARQIANGAPFDVFLSANEQFVDQIEQQGFVSPGRRAVYAEGRVGLWSPSGAVRTLAALTAPGLRHIAIPNPKHAPYGLAARELLQAASLWDSLQSRLVLAENVRQAFEYASTGNAEAVLTSWTLIHDKGGVLLPPNHAPLRQTAAQLKSVRDPSQAARFLDFLLSPAGRDILTRGGLFPPARRK